jgi:VanZ family protein/UDP-2,3-diacylglucosamine pyrophosphatase LpxH
MRRWLWLLPFSVAVAITALSHRSAYPLGIQLPPPLDKVAHLLAFGALATALDAAWAWTVPSLPAYRRQLGVFLSVCAFAALDEWHQSFVPGRDCSAWDWSADALGAALGLLPTPALGLKGRFLLALSWVKGKAERPDPARPLILVADPHWSEELTGLAAATSAHPEADWLFLGDVFDVWFGLPGMEAENHLRFLAWVDARRQAGRWVGLWTGNRDFFLDRHAGRFDYLGEGVGGGLPQEALSFEHGDLINGADLPYRAWSLVSRSGAGWAFARLLPGSVARALAHYLEQRMRTTNRSYRLAFPEAAFAAAAAEHPGKTFLTGHFHTHHQVDNGIALPWAHEGNFMVWQGGKIANLENPS